MVVQAAACGGEFDELSEEEVTSGKITSAANASFPIMDRRSLLRTDREVCPRIHRSGPR